MQHPLISVVIPTYDDISTLHNTVRSVLSQIYPNIEIWVIDDGSQKDLRFIIDDLNDPRINYVRMEKHTNANVARNEGIMRSRGEYIAMLDADDLWMPNHLADCLDALKINSADGVYGSLIVRSRQGDRTITVRSPQQGESMITYLLKVGYGAQTSTLFMTAASAKDILWDPTLNRHQDYDFVARYAKKYKMIPKVNPTVIYLVSDTPKKIDFESCIKVINGLRDEIAPAIYFGYTMNMRNVAVQMGASKTTIDHYTRELMRYPEYISFAQYVALVAPVDEEQRQKLKQKYIEGILK